MALKGIIHPGSSVSITFQADFTNTGSTALLTGFIPENGSVQMDVIAPGSVGTLSYDDVPTTARQLRILIDTPEPTGSGRLIVIENDIVKNDEPILNDNVWAYIIQ